MSINKTAACILYDSSDWGWIPTDNPTICYFAATINELSDTNYSPLTSMDFKPSHGYNECFTIGPVWVFDYRGSYKIEYYNTKGIIQVVSISPEFLHDHRLIVRLLRML
jgi:hypothetical protein